MPGKVRPRSARSACRTSRLDRAATSASWNTGGRKVNIQTNQYRERPQAHRRAACSPTQQLDFHRRRALSWPRRELAVKPSRSHDALNRKSLDMTTGRPSQELADEIRREYEARY